MARTEISNKEIFYMKKRILICDDNPTQFEGLRKHLDSKYDVHNVDKYTKIIDYLDKHGHFNLLILDLGYDGEYSGHTIIPEIEKKFPKQKIVIYSRIYNETLDDEKRRIIQFLHSCKSIVDGFDPGLPIEEKIERIEEKIGGPSFLNKGKEEIWILHLSDLQFGGPGVLSEPETLATLVTSALNSFIKGDQEKHEPLGREIPSIIVVSGDISQTSSPNEYVLASKFFKELYYELRNLSKDIEFDINNLINDTNIIQVPGNHDFNWSISRSRNIHEMIKDLNGTKKKTYVYIEGLENMRDDLNYIDYVSRVFFDSYIKIFDKKNSFFNKSFVIYNLMNEIGIIFILLDSTRFENHFNSIGKVTEIDFNNIKRELEKIDPEQKALRILITHHTLDSNANKDKQLYLENGDRKRLINFIRIYCNISIVLTGHLHNFNFSEIPADDDKKVIHIGSGTLRSDDLNKFELPKFVLLRIWDYKSTNDKFKKLTVYPFSYNGNIYQKFSTFNGGQNCYKNFDINY